MRDRFRKTIAPRSRGWNMVEKLERSFMVIEDRKEHDDAATLFGGRELWEKH